MRQQTLLKCTSSWSHAKTLSFAKAFLRYLTTIRLDTNILLFGSSLRCLRRLRCEKQLPLELSRSPTDIESILAYIRHAAQTGAISMQRMLQYSAFVVFGAYTGQRSNATMRKLTIGQFREALQREKPRIRVDASQDKIRFEHFVPLHESLTACRVLIGLIISALCLSTSTTST